jgi:hypothetical protein
MFSNGFGGFNNFFQGGNFEGEEGKLFFPTPYQYTNLRPTRRRTSTKRKRQQTL